MYGMTASHYFFSSSRDYLSSGSSSNSSSAGADGSCMKEERARIKGEMITVHHFGEMITVLFGYELEKRAVIWIYCHWICLSGCELCFATAVAPTLDESVTLVKCCSIAHSMLQLLLSLSHTIQIFSRVRPSIAMITHKLLKLICTAPAWLLVYSGVAQACPKFMQSRGTINVLEVAIFTHTNTIRCKEASRIRFYKCLWRGIEEWAVWSELAHF